jgi:hypothetical protein
MKLVLSIAAAWTVFDLLAGKVLVGIFGAIDLSLWERIAHAVAN